MVRGFCKESIQVIVQVVRVDKRRKAAEPESDEENAEENRQSEFSTRESVWTWNRETKLEQTNTHFLANDMNKSSKA